MAAVALLAMIVSGCRPPEDPPPAGAPRLILVIVVDQFSAGYIERFAPLWSGGLRRLLDEGVLFTDAHHRHAAAWTAVGSATLATGRYPRHHGIIVNYWYERDGTRRYAIADPEHGVSPKSLLAPTLGDWLKERWPRSRVFAASGKDRIAILLGGHRADGAFWYQRGELRSNTYYGVEPPWVAEFNAQKLADAELGTAWEPLPLTAEELAAAGVEPLDLGPLRPGFPHVFGSLEAAPDDAFYAGLGGSPWIDEQLSRFAERLIDEEALGADPWPDLLLLGYTALDSAGHRYGPQSREVLDVLLRLDRNLGELLASVERRVGAGSLVVALSSDHGVIPMPELGSGGRRVAAEDVLCMQQVEGHLDERFGLARWLLPGPFVNPEATAAMGVERTAVLREAARLFEACPAIDRVWTREELLAAEPPAAATLFANGFHPERSPDLEIDFVPYFMPTLAAATHRTDEPYDTHVPLILRVPGTAPGRDDAPAATVDLAPTLAVLAGLTPPEVDGVDLGPRLRRAAP